MQGVGYATIKDILSWKAHSSHHLTSEDAVNVTAHTVDTSGIDGVDDGIGNPPFCMLLFVVKFISVNMTIGSGASGGIFSPSLFIGATLGGLWGHIVSIIVSAQASYDPIQAVVAGMAGMVAGTTGASLTAITMTFEMSRDYAAILPIIITSVLSHMTRKAISEDSIYTLKLVRRGHVVPEGLQAAVHAAQRVKDVMTSDFRVITKQEPITQYEGVTLLVAEEDAAPGTRAHCRRRGPLTRRLFSAQLVVRARRLADRQHRCGVRTGEGRLPVGIRPGHAGREIFHGLGPS